MKRKLRPVWAALGIVAALGALLSLLGCHHSEPKAANYFDGPMKQHAMVGTRAGAAAQVKQ